MKLGQHRTIWQEHSAKDFASYESYKRAGILYVFPPFITARMGQKIGRRPQTQLCGAALKLRRRWEREVSLDYLMNEKFVQLAEPEQLEEYLFTACGQTAVLYHAELAAALARLPEQTQEEIFRYYFLRQPQRVIGVHIGRTRSTAGRHIQLALKRLRRLMEGKDHE